ncbi:MAG TPA: hypothetical protein VMU89_04590 [Thermomicrobiaceae bacterium]|nr:hypothetical protein [Thermomicrobiaceae bacterium]
MPGSKKPSKATRARWFEAGVVARGARFLEKGPGYVCPECLTAFPREALGDGRLTVEDVPPVVLGGKPLLLTCKACNNRAGRLHDRHAGRYEGVLNYLAREGSLKTRTMIAGQKLNVEFRLRPESPDVDDMIVWVKDNDEATVRATHAAVDRLALAGQLVGVELGFPVAAKASAVEVSLLRAAYLAAFAVLGYTYIDRPELKWVRDLVADPQADIVGPYLAEDDVSADPDRRLIGAVLTPEWLQSTIVIMGRHTVFLPHPDATSNPALYQRLAAHHGPFPAITTQLLAPGLTWPSEPLHYLDQIGLS